MERARAPLIALAVGLILADSSVVVLALPEILREFGTEVADVAWVLTIFNLVLALVAVPAAYLARRRTDRGALAVGLIVFAAASAACAAAPDLTVLLVARAVQAIGGALAIVAALEVLPRMCGGSEARAARLWALAGAAGAALGPAVGGVLTELIAWQAIFIVQVPLALVPLLALRGIPAPPRDRVPAGRPHIAANVALALVSASLVAALFLIVLLLIEGFRLTPIGAAVTVSAMPIASILTARSLRGVHVSARSRAVAGVLLLGGGLGALALLPGSSPWWTVPPQLAVGAGLALTLGALTEQALAGRSPQAVHGGWTIASRHAGVVVSILVLTPVFVSDLDTQRVRAERAGTALVLDAPIAFETKADLAVGLVDQLQAERGRIPDLEPAFGAVTPSEDDRPAYLELAATLEDQLDRAAASATARSFLVAAIFALLALIPLALVRRAPPTL